MCYYDCIVFSCQDWKWGNFKEHCSKEYRIGETCGMKLIYHLQQQSCKCKLCEKIDTKRRRREAEADRVRRWQSEGRCPASVEKSRAIINALDREMSELAQERAQRCQVIGGANRQYSLAELGSSRNSVEVDQHEVSHDIEIQQQSTASRFQPPDESMAEEPVERQLGQRKRACLVGRVASRRGLPIAFKTLEDRVTVMACADTGSEKSAMSAKLCWELGLIQDVMWNVDDPRLFPTFTLANGKQIQPCGRVIASCGLGMVSVDPLLWLSCTIYVFPNLSCELIMGSEFLESTHTMDKHRYRLVDLGFPEKHLPKIRSTGKPKKRLVCWLRDKTVSAIADTGSEVDLMSKHYATTQNFHVTENVTKVMFADGSIGNTIGVVISQVSIGTDKPIFDIDNPSQSSSTEPERLLQEYNSKTHSGSMNSPSNTNIEEQKTSHKVAIIKFYVLEGFTGDILLGEDSLETLDAFTRNMSYFRENGPNTHPAEMQRIIKLGRIQDTVSEALAGIGRLIGNYRGSTSATNAPEEVRADMRQTQDEEDQRENARREVESLRIHTLVGDARTIAQETEDRRCALYDAKRRRL